MAIANTYQYIQNIQPPPNMVLLWVRPKAESLHFCWGYSGLAPRLGVRLIQTRAAVPLSYTAYGDASRDRERPPLVILHGLFGQKNNWNSVSKALAKRLGSAIYAVDLRNHGASPQVDAMTYADMAADVALFIKQIKDNSGWERVSLLGHSMGGKAAMRLAVDPEADKLLHKLIIEDVSPKGYTSTNSFFRGYIKAMRQVNLRSTRKEVMESLEEAVPDMAVRQFLATNLQNSSEPGVLEWKCNIDAIDDHVDEVLGFSVPTGSFRRDTLFLYGGKSGYVPDEDRPQIKRMFPLVRFEAIEGAGHWVHAEKPAEFINSLCTFLEDK